MRGPEAFARRAVCGSAGGGALGVKGANAHSANCRLYVFSVHGPARWQLGGLCLDPAPWQGMSAVRKRPKGLSGTGPNAVPQTREG